MTHWNDIVPNRLFGLLPTLGKLEVKLTSHEILDPGQRPRFGVDSEQIIELLQGAGIYKDRWQSLRELLQNAVDATLMRIWLTHHEDPDSGDRGLEWGNPLSTDIREIFVRYPIKVSLAKAEGSASDRVEWRLDIRDKGIGISKRDLAFMKSVGASAKNVERRTIIARMPDWMRPSGAFGIGLQSAFLLCPEIIFDSKSLLSGDSLRVEMKSPIGEQRGLIYIQKCKHSPGRDSGTLLTMKIATKAIPKSISWNYESSTFAEKVLADFDPIRMAEVPYEAATIVDEILKFSILSPLPIHLNFNGQSMDTQDSNVVAGGIKPYFCFETGIMLNHVQFSNTNGLGSSVAFRGQRIKEYHPRIPFVHFGADILSQLAPDTLTINRNDIKDAALHKINKLLIDTIVSYLSRPDLSLTSAEIPAAAAFLYVHEKETAQPDLLNEWVNLVPEELGCSIADLCLRDKFELYVRSSRRTEDEALPKNSLCIQSTNVFVSPYLELLYTKWHRQNGYVQQKAYGDESILCFSMTDSAPFDDEFLRKALEQATMRIHLPRGRRSMPSWGEFERLSADVSKLPWCSSLSDSHFYRDHFILPFFFENKKDKVTTEGLDELCEWTIKNTRHVGITKTEIRELYDKFINWVDNQLLANNPTWRFKRGLDQSSNAADSRRQEILFRKFELK